MTSAQGASIPMFDAGQLCIDQLRAGYVSGQLRLQTVFEKLRDQALNDTHSAWIYVLSEAELSSYIDAIEHQDPSSLPLYGVPFAVKDNIDIVGIPTTAACPAFAYNAEKSATVVARLVSAGAVPLGKTNLDQFATGLVGTRSPYGEGRNALNPDCISGGSSSGSAIATALGQVSFALGTDTAGSGRVPTALNNLIGHKPSNGLLSTSGVVPACRSLDCVTIMASCTQDVATVLNAAIAYDPNDSYSRHNEHYNTLPYFGQPPGRFDFAVPDQLEFYGDQAAAGLFDMAVSKLTELGGRVHRLPFKTFYAAAQMLYAGPWVAERRFATTSVDAADRLPILEQILEGSHAITAEEAFEAEYQRREYKQQCDALLAPYAFVLTPTTPTVYTRQQVAADPVELNSRLGVYTNFMNLLDYAATAVPVGMHPSGTSWGVTLFAKRNQDYRLLSFAQSLQQILGLPLGASNAPLPKVNPTPAQAHHEDRIELAVCGAHLSEQPLNWQLMCRGAHLVAATQTQSCYSLYALADGKRPALVRNESRGAAIDVEIWSVPHETLGSFVHGIVEPLAIGKVELSDGRWVTGFVCADGVPDGAREITAYGGWRRWLVSNE